MPIVQLNYQFLLTGLTVPPGMKKIEYVDNQRTGLYVLVTSSQPGRGTFYVRFKRDNRTAHHRLGSTKEITLEQARAQTEEFRAKLKLGFAPEKSIPTEKQEELSLSEFFEQHYIPHAKHHKRSWKDDEYLFNLRVRPTALANQKLSELNRLEIEQLHAGILNRGLSPVSANHVVRLLRHSLNLAVEWSMMAVNPAAKIKLFHEDNQKERYMSDEELKRLLTVLKRQTTVPSLIFQWLLSTGCRSGECRLAMWNHIDREHRLWRIPAENAKSRKVRSVPLNDAALGILDALDTEGNHGYLFVNPRTGEHYKNLHKAWEVIRQEAGLTQLRIHDLRHNFASMLVNSGRTLYETQMVLGHADPKVTMRYSHLSTKSLQEAANSAGDVIKRAMEG